MSTPTLSPASQELELLRAMLRIRLIEEAIAERYAEQEMRCPVHLSIGQEAPAVGVCSQLRPTDYAISSHRSHGHYLAKGGSLPRMMAELYGKATGCASGRGGSMHLVDLEAGFLGAAPIVGSTIPIGVGAAFGSQLRGEDRVAAVFFGEGSTEEGVFHESVNFALLKNLPVLFVCENNLYSVYSPLEVRQPAGQEVFKVAAGHGIESFQADGNDVRAVAELARGAVDKARRGGGPTFMELKTYRWREHCGPGYDNDIGYRELSEYQEWKLKCPLELLRAHLEMLPWFTSSQWAEAVTGIEAEIEAAIAFAKESPFPDVANLLQGVYAA